MRREGHDHVAAGGQGELLVELGHVAVMADAIGVEALGHFREQHFLFRRPARAGHARLGVDDDLVGIDGLGFEQRNQRQLGAGRVAAGIGDEPRRLDLVPINFGQAVDRSLLQFGREMLVAVPARIGGGIGEAEIGREVDDFGLRRPRHQILDDLLRRAVRQRAEREIEPERLPIGVLDRGQRRQRIGRELRKDVGHGLAGAAIGRQQHDLDARMANAGAAPIPRRYSRRRRARRFLLSSDMNSTFGLRKIRPISRAGYQDEECRGTGGTNDFTRERASVPCAVRRRRIAMRGSR